jgi:hypothetical protein
LSQDSSKWEQLASQNNSIVDQDSKKVSEEKIKELYSTHTKDANHPASFEHLVDISKSISENSDQYHHCEYQALIAAITIS